MTKCVIAGTCIGGAAEAAQTAEKFAREGVGLSITDYGLRITDHD